MPRRKVSLGADGEEPAVSSPPPEVKESSHAEVETESVELTASEESAAENIDETNNEVDLVSDGSDDEQKKTTPEENSNEPSEDITSQEQSDEEVDIDVETKTENDSPDSDFVDDEKEISDYLSAETGISDNEPEEESPAESNEESSDEEIPESVPTLSRMNRGKRRIRQITLSGEYEFTPSLKQKYDDLYKALKDKRTLKAKIVKQAPGDVIAAQCTISGYEEFTILVPNQFMDFSAMSSDVPKTLQAKKIADMIGAEINVVIESLDFKSRLCIGNRALANYFLRRRYYYRGRRLPGAKRSSIVSIGTVVKNAPIIEVTSQAIRVDVLGAVSRIPLEELSYEYVFNAREKFHVGKKIDVVVKELEKIETSMVDAAKAGYPVKLAVSYKDLIDDESAINLLNATEGEIVIATVKRITSSDKVMLRTATGYNCHTRRVNGRVYRTLRVGSEVKVRLLVKDMKRSIGVVDIIDII